MPFTIVKLPEISLRATIVSTFVLQVVAAVGLTGWLSFRNGQKSVDELVSKIADETTDHVETYIRNFAETPYQFLQINAAWIQTGQVDLTDQSVMARYFWRQVNISEAVPFLYFGNSQGDFVGVWKQSDNLTTLQIRNPSTAPLREIYKLDAKGNPIARLSSQEYDPRVRPWYRAAAKAEQPTWSPIYVFATAPRLGITHSLPIYDASGALLGVLSVDMPLSDISDFLAQIDTSESGQVFVIERSGDLVASSTADPAFIRTKGEERQLLATQSHNPLVQAAAQDLLTRFKGFEQIAAAEQFTFNIGQSASLPGSEADSRWSGSRLAHGGGDSQGRLYRPNRCEYSSDPAFMLRGSSCRNPVRHSHIPLDDYARGASFPCL